MVQWHGCPIVSRATRVRFPLAPLAFIPGPRRRWTRRPSTLGYRSTPWSRSTRPAAPGTQGLNATLHSAVDQEIGRISYGRQQQRSGGQEAKPPGSQPRSSLAVGPSGQPGWSAPDRPLGSRVRIPVRVLRNFTSGQVQPTEERVGSEPAGCGFESHPDHSFAPVGKRRSHLVFNQGIPGSNPGRSNSVRLPDSRRRDLVASQTSSMSLEGSTPSRTASSHSSRPQRSAGGPPCTSSPRATIGGPKARERPVERSGC